MVAFLGMYQSVHCNIFMQLIYSLRRCISLVSIPGFAYISYFPRLFNIEFLVCTFLRLTFLKWSLKFSVSLKEVVFQ